MSLRFLTALPVYNERNHVTAVLDEVGRYSSDILVVDDGSTDGTADLLADRNDVQVARHTQNQGYGAALMTAFRFAKENHYEFIVTIDCDGQHEPQRIPRFVHACHNVDIVSGSRYLKQYAGDSEPPAGRRWVNQQITAEINCRLGFHLTDAFCGFKAYRVAAIDQLTITETGYAMPLELWVQAAHHKLDIVELPTPLIYLDEDRSFGGVLDDTATRIDYYHSVLHRSIDRVGEMKPIPELRCLFGENAG